MSTATIHIPKRILPTIVVAQFLCTSLWFAGNAIVPDIVEAYNLAPSFLANSTSAVQLGFIVGTLVFALLAIADRYSPSRVFALCAFAGAAINLSIAMEGISATGLLLSRFCTGFFLAGIYPVGMKIASDYYNKGLGRSLGYLVGALALGTALPHLLKNYTTDLPWRYVVVLTSSLAALGGLAILLLVPNGPFRKAGHKLQLSACLQGFKKRDFRAAAFGYFGHMWELYAFWAFVPVVWSNYAHLYPNAGVNVPLYSFCVIAGGGLACVLGGNLAQRFGAQRIAAIALGISGVCCLFSPWLLEHTSLVVLFAFLMLWGGAVIADSPLFSTLVAQRAPANVRGTALTIVNCIGFATTIGSIQLVQYFSDDGNTTTFLVVLAIGPAFGLLALLRNRVSS